MKKSRPFRFRLRAGECDTIPPGYGAPIDAVFPEEQIERLRTLPGGSCKSEFYPSFAGDARLCRYKRAAVAFKPANLRLLP
ncbi:hypothetical protein JW906_12000 [bacterium]|nr:hypothetical protein [bacterium]